MGSGVSSALETPGADLRLPATGLRFTTTQLHSLNEYVDNLYQQDQLGRMSPELESSVESLVQRIVDGAGQRDPRFRCCHLIALHREKKMRSRSLEYLVTLDSFPTLNAGDDECTIQEGPPGYAKIRVTGRTADKWEEFLTPNGYLCRDKILERWVELVARCAHAKGGGGPRVIGARAAQHALPHLYCYLERASPAQIVPEQRLAIVEGAAWVMVRAGAGQAEAKLMLATRVQGCSSAAYTCKVPLTHPMALLHYTAAHTDFFAAAVGPPTSIVCAERQATWQLWSPGLEATLDSQYAEQSTPGRISGALNALIDRMRDGVVQGSVRVLSRYSASCAVRRRLDKCGLYGQSAARACVSQHAAHHFLLILDDLISVCKHRGVTGYVFDLDRASISRRGIRAADADWSKDAECLTNLLHHLQAESSTATGVPLGISETLEMVLFRRWENMIKESKASASSTPTYSRRQLKYIWRLASALLKCKARVVCESQSTFRANLIQATSIDQEPIEDLIHILAIMLDQARDLYLVSNCTTKNTHEFDRDIAVYRSKKWNKLKDYYDGSSACLIDAVRRDPSLRQQDLSDECTAMKHILNWMYKGAKDDKKYLGPVLKPYLDGLFATSLEVAWFIEDFDSKKCTNEYEGLKEFCLGVHDGKVEPCIGLLEAGKKLAWAKAMVDLIDRSKHVELRLVFPTGDGMAVSYLMKLPSRREHSSARALTLNRRDKAEAKLRLARRCVVAAFTSALAGGRRINKHIKEINRHGSTDEILASIKSGHYWRNSTKPDIIPASSVSDFSSSDNLPRVVRRRSRRSRPATAYGFPEIQVTKESDSKTMRKKYHTLKSLVYTEPLESIKEMKQRPRSAGSTMRCKETMSRPGILETLDFINGIKDALCVEESGTSDMEESCWSARDDWLLSESQPLNVLARLSAADTLHLTLGDLLLALLHRGKFTILQELCSWLGESGEGALFALHRLARAARSRSSERPINSWKLPEAVGVMMESEQKYRARPPDYMSSDDAPQPPPLPRTTSRRQITQKRLADYQPPKRLRDLENHLKNLEIMHAKLNLNQNLTKAYPSSNVLNENYTGILNPVYDESKIPKDKFSNPKRSKSLGRSFSSRKIGLEVSRYNITLGHKSRNKTNDVVTAIMGTTGETGLDTKSNFFQRYSSTASVVGDSYKLSRITID